MDLSCYPVLWLEWRLFDEMWWTRESSLFSILNYYGVLIWVKSNRVFRNYFDTKKKETIPKQKKSLIATCRPKYTWGLLCGGDDSRVRYHIYNSNREILIYQPTHTHNIKWHISTVTSTLHTNILMRWLYAIVKLCSLSQAILQLIRYALGNAIPVVGREGFHLTLRP